MKERPIIFNTENVKAILEGRKTQTRRVIKPQPNLLYSVYGGIIQVIHNDLDREDNNGKLDIEANTSITKRQLYGGKRWEDIFKDKIQRLREEGFSGLVSISGTRYGAERIFSGFLIPQQYQGDKLSSPPSMYGVPRDASQEVNASEASGRELSQQQTKQSKVGNSIRELAGQTDAQSTQSLLQQSKFKDILRGQGTYPLGSKQGDSQQKVYSKSIGNEPAINIRNLPWVIGQRLWMRETWTYLWLSEIDLGDVIYRATEPNADFTVQRWKPSIHMFRKDSRITLEITGLRVERLQEISGNDCVAEGFIVYPDMPAGEAERQEFAVCWDSLNAKRGYGWESNSWVWVIEFIKP